MLAKNYTLDRIEYEYAVLTDDDGNTTDVSLSLIPFDAKEGDVILYDGESFVIDERLTIKRREDIRSRFDRLKKKK